MGDPIDVTPARLRDWPLPNPDGDSKESRGQVLVVGGSARTPGAVLLAAVAALRSGAGKLQVATVASRAGHLAVAVPEALVEPLAETSDGAISAQAADQVADLAEDARSVLIGPGMTDKDECCALTAGVLDRISQPTVVLDALGLALLSANRTALADYAGGSIVTPNPSELGRMLDIEAQAVTDDPVGSALRAAETFGTVVSLGGGESIVATPDDRAWRDATGSIGLGVSGSGDAFAGIVTGLAARGAEPAQAAVWAAYLHGRAGDRLAARVGRLGYLAREVVDEVPLVLTELES